MNSNGRTERTPFCPVGAWAKVGYAPSSTRAMAGGSQGSGGLVPDTCARQGELLGNWRDEESSPAKSKQQGVREQVTRGFEPGAKPRLGDGGPKRLETEKAPHKKGFGI